MSSSILRFSTCDLCDCELQLFCGEFVKRIKLAQNQAFWQCSIKNKKKGLLVFLEINGLNTTGLE